MVSGAIMVASYFISSLSFMNEGMEAAAKFLPYHYFQTVLSFSEMNLGWWFGLLGISLLMVLAAWLLFIRKDIRLAGEGSWYLPRMINKRSVSEAA